MPKLDLNPVRDNPLLPDSVRRNWKALVALQLLLGLGVAGVVAYVVLHFVAKFW